MATFNIGIVPVNEAADPTEAGVVKMFKTAAGIGIVPIKIIADLDVEAGVVPCQFVGAAGIDVVSVHDVDS